MIKILYKKGVFIVKKDKNKNIILVLLIVIIVILATLVILFATNTISFMNTKTIKSNEENSSVEGNEEELVKKLTMGEATSILKATYNEAVRHIFNESSTYCGKTATGEGSTLDLNGLLYQKSVTYHSVKEVEAYLKDYMTEKLLSTSNYNHTITDTSGNTISSYYEKDGNLYCNSWNKGSNVELSEYLEEESTFEIISIEDNSFMATIHAVYYDANGNYKTTVPINVSVIRQNDNWVLNTYERVG